jgi:hypothetical protein
MQSAAKPSIGNGSPVTILLNALLSKASSAVLHAPLTIPATMTTIRMTREYLIPCEHRTRKRMSLKGLLFIMFMISYFSCSNWSGPASSLCGLACSVT